MNVLISYPRSGRAWSLSIFKRLKHAKVRSRIHHDHDDSGDFVIRRYKASKERWRQHRVVLLIRDPRDVVVSHWHALKFRAPRFAEKWGDMSLFDWIREPEGIDFPIRFLNDWAKTDIEYLLIRYEDMKRDVVSVVGKAMKYWDIVQDENDERLECVREVDLDWVRRSYPGSNFEEDSRANSVRRGETGVWREYFTKSQQDWIMKKVQDLDPVYSEYLV